MAFTRFHDDPYRIRKSVEESAGLGKYMLNVPGPGNFVAFSEDPQIRLQRWGANMMTNTVNLESDLFNLPRKINHNALDSRPYRENAVATHTVAFPIAQPFVEESRASHPAWMYKDKEHTNWSYPQLNPQYRPGSYAEGSFGLARGFHENISTRILEKDFFQPSLPVVSLEHNVVIPDDGNRVPFPTSTFYP
jgi:hypothetical protein